MSNITTCRYLYDEIRESRRVTWAASNRPEICGSAVIRYAEAIMIGLYGEVVKVYPHRSDVQPFVDACGFRGPESMTGCLNAVAFPCSALFPTPCLGGCMRLKLRGGALYRRMSSLGLDARRFATSRMFLLV